MTFDKQPTKIHLTPPKIDHIFSGKHASTCTQLSAQRPIAEVSPAEEPFSNPECPRAAVALTGDHTNEADVGQWAAAVIPTWTSPQATRRAPLFVTERRASQFKTGRDNSRR